MNKRFLTTTFYTIIGLDAALALFVLYNFLLTRTSSITTLLTNTSDTPFYIWFYIVSSILAFILFGLDLSLTVHVFRQTNNLRGKEGGSTVLGTLVGAFAASCPICSGVLLSLVGITGGLAVFPFKGLELKALSVVLLVLPLFFLIRRVRDPNCDNNCPVPQNASYQKKDRLLFVSLIIFFITLLFATSTLLKEEPILNSLFDKSQVVFTGAENICKVVKL
ncbi:hypothetical protein HY025_00905 [Candidatus Daviesbacteria bacterium]|nr:hypothetical protein [Candidatus Daviesbacteria bacterium]